MKSLFVNYTTIPPQVPRQLAIEILHSHGEIITLNPLVIDYNPMKPPRDAPNDEYYATWYEIHQRINLIPGIGKMGSTKVSFNGCFHDMPWGLQTHMYVPMGIELRHSWHVKGNEPGEAPEARELGSEAPASGLYLEERVQIDANALAMPKVKKELKAASAIMIDRMIKKAELLDAGVLQAMFENGKLKTINPMDRTNPLHNSPATGPGERWRPNSVSRDSTYSRNSTYSQPSQYAAPAYNNQPPPGAIEMLADTHYHTAAGKSPNPGFMFEMSADVPNPDTRWSAAPSGGSQTDRSSIKSPPSSFTTPNLDKAGGAQMIAQHPAFQSPDIGSLHVMSPEMAPRAKTPPPPAQQFGAYSPQSFNRSPGGR